MTRSALTLTTILLALGAPMAALAQDTTTPPSTEPPPTDPAAVPGDQAAPAAPGDAADPDEEQPAQPQGATTTPTTGGSESGQGLETDMAAADADTQAETTPVSPVSQAAVEAEEEKLPFRGSIFFWDHSYNVGALGLPYRNPTYTWWFSFRPRWYFGEDYYAAARFDAYYELTDSDSTTTNRQLDLGDAILSFGRPKIVELEHIRLGATASLTLPLSIASRANGLIAGTGLSVRATREFEDIAEGVTLDASFGYTHYWNTGNTLTRDDAGAGAVTPAGSTSSGFATDPVTCATAQQAGPDGSTPEGACSGGASTVSDSFILTLTGSIAPIKRMSIDLSYSWWWRAARRLADATVDVMGHPVTLTDGSATHWRNLQVFSVSVGYDIVPWLNASLSFGTLTPQLSSNGRFRNPFWDPDTAVDLNLTVALDELYKVFRPTPQTIEHNPTATARARTARGRQ